MAPQPTYDPPHVQLGRLMVEARRRGLSFDEWWDEAVRPHKPLVMTNHPCACGHVPMVHGEDGCSADGCGCRALVNTVPCAVRWPSDRNPRLDWQAAINGSREGWRRAYERRPPTVQEAALTLLAPGLDALDEVASERAADEPAARRAGIGPRGAVASAA